MPKNRHFSLRVVVGDAELPEYCRDGVFYVECPLETPFSYMLETQEMKDGELETQIIPVTPYKIKIYARTTATNFYRISIDGQLVTPVSCPPKQSRYSSGFIKDGNLLEYLFSLPKLVANMKEKIEKNKAPKVGTITAECWKATPVNIRDVDYRLSFKQASKQDSALVTKGLYTMTTTRIGKELTTNRPTRSQIWRPKKLMSKLTLHYRLTSDLVDMGFKIKRIPFRKRYPSNVLPDPMCAVRNQSNTESRQSLASRTTKSSTQPSASYSQSPESSQSQFSDVNSTTNYPETSMKESLQDSSAILTRVSSIIPCIQDDSSAHPQRPACSQGIVIDSLSTSPNKTTEIIDQGTRASTSEKASNTRSHCQQYPSPSSTAEDKNKIQYSQRETLDDTCRNVAVVMLSSDDEIEDQDLIIISASEFNKGINLKTQKTLDLSTRASTEIPESSSPSSNSCNSKPTQSCYNKNLCSTASLTPIESSGREESLCGTRTAPTTSVAECTSGLGIDTSSTSNPPCRSLSSTEKKTWPAEKPIKNPPITEPGQLKLTSTQITSLIAEQFEIHEPDSLSTSSAEVMKRASTEALMDCADETTGINPRSKRDGFSPNAPADAKTNNNLDNLSTESLSFKSGNEIKTSVDENGNITTMHSLKSMSFQCESEPTTNNSQDQSQRSKLTSMLKVENKSTLTTKSTKISNGDDKQEAVTLTTFIDNNNDSKFGASTKTRNFSEGIKCETAFVSDRKPLSSLGNDIQISLSKRKHVDTKHTVSLTSNKYEIKKMKPERQLGSRRKRQVKKRTSDTTSRFDKDSNGNLDNRPEVFKDKVTGNFVSLRDVDIKKELIDEDKDME